MAHLRAGALRRACLVLAAVVVVPGLVCAAEEVRQVFSGTLISDTSRAEQLFTQGMEHAKAGRDSLALQAFQRTWRWDPTRDDALLRIPGLAAKLDRLDTAARYALIVVRSKKTEAVLSDPTLYRRLATHAAEQRDHALAAELWEALYDQAATNGQAAANGANSGNRSLQQKLALEVGRLWFLSGDAAEASDWFHRVAENPLDDLLSREAGKLWEGFASCHLEAERFDRVEQALTRLAEETNGEGRATYWQARLALEQNQPAVALEKINEFLATGNTNSNGLAYELLVQALRATNQADRAAEELQRLHKNYPNDPEAWLVWIDQLTATGNRAQALAQARQLVKTTLASLENEETSAWDNTLLADAADRQIKLLGSLNQADRLWPLLVQLTAWWGSLEPVRESLEQALSSDPLAELAGVWLATRHPGEMSSDELTAAGRIALTLDRAEGAAPFYRPLVTQCMAHDAEHPDDPTTAVDSLHGWLYDLIDLEAWPQVIEAIEWARNKEVPQASSADMSYWLTYGYENTGQNKKALATIRSARKIAPDNLIYTEMETALLVDMLRVDEAIIVAQVGLTHSKKKQREPRQITRTMQMMLALWLDERAGHDDSEPADELLETVLDSWPLDPLANNDLAYRWADRGVHLDRSLRMAQVAVEANPANASSADTLGWVLFRLGRNQEAAQELRRATGLLSSEKETPDFAVLYEHLAAALEATGDADGATEAKGKAKRLRESAD